MSFMNNLWPQQIVGWQVSVKITLVEFLKHSQELSFSSESEIKLHSSDVAMVRAYSGFYAALTAKLNMT